MRIIAFVTPKRSAPSSHTLASRLHHAGSCRPGSATTRVDGLDATAFQSPQLVSWPSFDGLAVSGFITRPPATFTGKRPLLIAVRSIIL